MSMSTMITDTRHSCQIDHPVLRASWVRRNRRRAEPPSAGSHGGVAVREILGDGEGPEKSPGIGEREIDNACTLRGDILRPRSPTPPQ
jgi:hypothetical protein